MPFPINTPVFVRNLKQAGRIIELRSRGRCLVAIGDLTINCKVDELQELPAEQALRPERQEAGIREAIRNAERGRGQLLEVDLHGFRVAEALQFVEAKIDKAVLAGVDEIRFIHGIGSGAIRIALHQLLTRLSVVREFRIDAINSGITRVFL